MQVHQVTRRAKRSHLSPHADAVGNRGPCGSIDRIAAAAREVIGPLNLEHLNVIYVCDFSPQRGGESGFQEVRATDIFDLIAWSHDKAQAEGWKRVDLWYRTATVGGRSRAYVRALERFPEWQVYNRDSGAYLCTYPGDTDGEALDNLARYAGYSDFARLLDEVPGRLPFGFACHSDSIEWRNSLT